MFGQRIVKQPVVGDRLAVDFRLTQGLGIGQSLFAGEFLFPRIERSFPLLQNPAGLRIAGIVEIFRQRLDLLHRQRGGRGCFGLGGGGRPLRFERFPFLLHALAFRLEAFTGLFEGFDNLLGVLVPRLLRGLAIAGSQNKACEEQEVGSFRFHEMGRQIRQSMTDTPRSLFTNAQSRHLIIHPRRPRPASRHLPPDHPRA